MAVACLTLANTGARAQEVTPADIEAVRQTTNKLIEQLIQSGILSKEKAQALLEDAKRAAQTAPEAKKGKDALVRVPYVPKVVRDQIKQELREDVEATARQERWGRPAAYPEWLERFRFSGDVRLRYQRNLLDSNNAQFFYLNVQESNAGGGDVLLNTTKSDDLWRIRARLGVDVKMSDWSSAALRLVTGSSSDPVSDNQTLGTTFNKSSFSLDRAWLKIHPSSWWSFTGGRIPNQFFYSDLVWDDDLAFEGGAVTVRPDLSPSTKPFLVAGAFPLEKIGCGNASQNARCGRDKWLYGLQVGAEQNLGAKARFKGGLAYYYYRNMAASFNDPVVDPANRTTIPKYLQKGNTLFNVVTKPGDNPLYGLASNFRLLNLTTQLELSHMEPYRVTLLGDYVRNIGYNRDEIRARTGGLVDQPAHTVGYNLRATVGHPTLSAPGNWQVFGGYKYVQRDAVFDGFTDSDFHLGGTDARGWMLGGSYGLGNNTYLRGRWFSANEIDGPRLSIDVFQLDLTAEF